MENLLNIKSNWKHNTLEYLIKQNDPSQDMSRAAVFEREVRAAQGVNNWKEISVLLLYMVKEDDAPIFTGLQAKYTDEIASILEEVKKNILDQLSDSIKILQTQYMVQLLQMNYLQKLKRSKVSLQPEHIDVDDVDIPEMMKIITQIILTEKNSQSLKDIRTILVEWRNSHETTV